MWKRKINTTQKTLILKNRTNHCWLDTQTHGQYCELPPCHEAWRIAVEKQTNKKKKHLWWSSITFNLLWETSYSFSATALRPHLFDGVQRGSCGYDWHENNGRSIVIILISSPQDHTEELEDVKRVEDLQKKNVKAQFKSRRWGFYSLTKRVEWKSYFHSKINKEMRSSREYQLSQCQHVPTLTQHLCIICGCRVFT